MSDMKDRSKEIQAAVDLIDKAFKDNNIDAEVGLTALISMIQQMQVEHGVILNISEFIIPEERLVELAQQVEPEQDPSDDPEYH